MDFSEEIINFVSNEIGGIVVIAEGSSEIVYADEFFTKKYGTAQAVPYPYFTIAPA